MSTERSSRRSRWVLPVVLALMTGPRITAQPAAGNYAPDEIPVRFSDDASALDVAAAATLVGADVIKRFDIVDGLYLLKLPKDLDPRQAAAVLRAQGSTIYAEPNYTLHIAATVPNDPRFGELWGLHNTGQSSGTADGIAIVVADFAELRAAVQAIEKRPHIPA